MANAESTRGANGQPYRRRDVVLASDPVDTFDAAMGRAGAVGVKVADIVEDQTPFKRGTIRRTPTRTPTGSWPCPTSTCPKRWSTCWPPAARIRRT